MKKMIWLVNLMRPFVQVTGFIMFFDKEEEIIKEGPIFWVNNNKNIWEGRVI